jgi:low affinity Fe/Cu permease
MQIKLDELIRVTRTASNKLLDLEELDDRDLEALRQSYEKLAQEMPHHGARAGRKPSPGR